LKGGGGEEDQVFGGMAQPVKKGKKEAKPSGKKKKRIGNLQGENNKKGKIEEIFVQGGKKRKKNSMWSEGYLGGGGAPVEKRKGKILFLTKEGEKEKKESMKL